MYVDFTLTNEQIWSIIACMTMMVFDILTGFIGAWKNRDIQSNKIRDGLFHKTALILVICLAYLCEIFMFRVPSFGWDFPMILGVCAIIVLMEISSILENITIINPDLKNTKLLEKFAVLKSSEKSVDDIGSTD